MRKPVLHGLCCKYNPQGVHNAAHDANKVINNSCETRSRFSSVLGCRLYLPDGIRRATYAMMGGKRVWIFGYGDVGKGLLCDVGRWCRSAEPCAWRGCIFAALA